MTWRQLSLLIILSLWMGMVAAQPHPAELAMEVPTLTLNVALLEKRAQSLTENAKALAQGAQDIAEAEQQLDDKINKLTVQTLQDNQIQVAELQARSLEVKLTELDLAQQALESGLSRKREEIQAIKDDLLDIQKIPIEAEAKRDEQHQTIAELTKQLALQQRDFELDQIQLTQLGEQHAQVKKQNALNQRWLSHLHTVWKAQQQQTLSSDLQEKQQVYLGQMAHLLKQLADKEQNSHQLALLNMQLQVLQAQLQRSQNTLKYAEWQMQLDHIQLEPSALPDYQAAIKQLNNLQAHIIQQQQWQQQTAKSVVQQQALLQEQQTVLRGQDKRLGAQTAEMLVTLANVLQQDDQTLEVLLNTIKTHEKKINIAYETNLRQRLFRQRRLPKNEQQWHDLAIDLGRLPQLFINEWQVTWQSLRTTARHMTKWMWWLFALGSLAGLGMVLLLRRTLCRWRDQWRYQRKDSFILKIGLLGLQLLAMNIIGLAVIAWLSLLLWIAQPPTDNNVTFVMTFLLAWVGAKVSINLAWLLLSSRHIIKLRCRSRTYRHLVAFIWLMGMFTVVTVIAHVVGSTLTNPLSETSLDIVDTAFMLFLSWLVLPVIRLRWAALNFLRPISNVYWLNVMRLSTLLIPFFLLAVSLLGLLGYINMGWYVARQLSIFLLMLSVWLVARGLLKDGEVWLKNISLRYSSYSLLWTQDVIPLLKKILTILLFFCMLWLWFWSSGWLHDVAVMQGLEAILTYPLMTLGSSHLHLLNLLKAFAVLWLVFWFGNWCKQVTYRWIYSSINDLGARHSLSVFTQYAVVCMGLLISLQLVGIDLTTVTVFAGALGVGIGFGLQNIANNFISGVLLLLERPLRTGDIINVADKHEGEVTRIGIRALTVRTWNHQEVIVPNSEFINNSFMNLTHSDSILRTTWYLRIGYDTDPALALQVLRDALATVGNLVEEPKSQVNIWEFTESSMLFRLDYYINMNKSSILAVRTEVALKMWNVLREAGIHVAYQQHDVTIKNASMSEPMLNSL